MPLVSPAPKNVSERIADRMATFRRDPLACAKFSFPWHEIGPLEEFAGPRQWQADVMSEIGSHLSGPNWFTPLQIAIASGHGIGKTALIAMLSHWAMSTCADTRVMVTANTEDQLTTKTWPEISKWFGMAINADWWTKTATRIVSSQKGHEDSWRLDRVTWSENNTEAFQGLHNLRKRIVVIFEEASGIPPKIWQVTQGALTDEDTEIIWLAFGNPTQNTGDFRECFGRMAHRWSTRHIDSRTVPGTNRASDGAVGQRLRRGFRLCQGTCPGRVPSCRLKPVHCSGYCGRSSRQECRADRLAGNLG